jgi:hypothetical protein
MMASRLGFSVSLWPCPLRHFTGIPCPTCGMTRSLLALAQGDWSASLSYHLFGVVLVGGLALMTLHWLLEVTQRQRIQTFYTRLCRRRDVQITAAALLMVYYGTRLWFWAQSGELQVAIAQSPLGQFW